MTPSAAYSLMSVLERTAIFANEQSYEYRSNLSDILINPIMNGYSVGDFGHGEGIIERGVIAGREHVEELAALVDMLANYPPKKVTPHTLPDSVSISRVEVVGLDRVSETYVLGNIGAEAGSNKAVKDLEESINVIYGSGYFNKVSYQLLRDSSEPYVMIVNVEENDYDIDMGVGLHYDPDFSTSVLINLAGRNWLLKGTRFNADLIISEHPRFNVFYELDRGLKPGFGIKSEFFSQRPELYENGKFLGNYSYRD